MARPFDFPTSEQAGARFRQDGLCAVCGESLDDVEEFAHHVVPNQSGQAGNPAHGWLSSADNCVVLCAQCHYRVHEDGHYRTGAVAPASYFPHSHGRNSAAHQAWARDLALLTTTIWP